MKISTSENVITINENIKSVSDFQDIKSTVDRVLETHRAITIEIKDSISITSSIIGYFNKLVLKDNIKLNLKVSKEPLMSLIEDLNLASTLNAQKV